MGPGLGGGLLCGLFFSFLSPDDQSGCTDADAQSDPRAGTFVDGMALDPGLVEVLAGRVELGLGLARALDLRVHDDECLLHLRHVDDEARPWTLFTPLGGRLFVDCNRSGDLHGHGYGC